MNGHVYPRYERYKDSGVEWLGEIPVHWKQQRLKWLAPLHLRKAGEEDAARPYVGLENAQSWTGRYMRSEATEQTTGDSVLFEPSHLLFGKLRPYLAKALKPGFSGRCTGEFLVLSPSEVSRDFLHAVLLSDPFVRTVDSSTFGTKMPRADWHFVGNMPIPLPPDAEQSAIAAFLDRETAKIDALIEKQERLIERLEEKRKALISHAVTQGLNPNVKMKESGVEWMGRIPEHWSVERNRWLFRERDDRSTDGSEELLTVSHITGVTPRAEKDVFMFLAETNEGYKRCRPGDLVINTMWAWMGALGVSAYAGIVSPSYNVYVPVCQGEARFFDYLYRTPAFINEIIRWSKGVWSSRLRLYPTEFLNVRTALPPVDEQREIVAHLDEESHRVESMIGKVGLLIEKLREKRTALISAAVTGKIRISDATGDEP